MSESGESEVPATADVADTKLEKLPEEDEDEGVSPPLIPEESDIPIAEENIEGNREEEDEFVEPVPSDVGIVPSEGSVEEAPLPQDEADESLAAPSTNEVIPLPSEASDDLEGHFPLMEPDEEGSGEGFAEIEEEEEDIASDKGEKLLKPRDFQVEDPSFLDEFESSVELVVKKEIVIEEVVEEVEEEAEAVSDEDKYAIYEVPPSTVTTDIYDIVCDMKSFISSESLFSLKENLFRKRREEEEPVCPSKERVDEMENLKRLAYPGLVRALAETCLYQPSRPTEYLSRVLERWTKSREELGMDPDPRAIQELVDRHEKHLERERWLRRQRYAGVERSSTSEEGSRSSAQGLKSKDTLSNEPQRFQDARARYMEAIKLLAQEGSKVERIRRGGRDYKKYSCLGPTSLTKGFLPATDFTQEDRIKPPLDKEANN